MWIREALGNELLSWTEGWYRFPLWPRVSALLLERQMWFLQGSSSTWRSTVQRTSRQWPPQSIFLTQPLPSLVKRTIDLCAVLQRNPSDWHRIPERTNWALAAGHLICLTSWGEALWWMRVRASANDACSEVMSRVSSDVTPAGKLERWLPDGCARRVRVHLRVCVYVSALRDTHWQIKRMDRLTDKWGSFGHGAGNRYYLSETHLLRAGTSFVPSGLDLDFKSL